MFNYNNFDYINLILYIIWKFLKRESIISSNLEYISAILFLIKTLDSITKSKKHIQNQNNLKNVKHYGI